MTREGVTEGGSSTSRRNLPQADPLLTVFRNPIRDVCVRRQALQSIEWQAANQVCLQNAYHTFPISDFSIDARKHVAVRMLCRKTQILPRAHSDPTPSACKCCRRPLNPTTMLRALLTLHHSDPDKTSSPFTFFILGPVYCLLALTISC